MKRLPPPHALESLTAPRRKRALSEDERALWESVAKQIKPLRKKPRAPKAPTAAAVEHPPVVAPRKSPPALRSAKAATPNVLPPAPPLASLGRRDRSQLSRGRKGIDARLDLHGMTQTRAHRALLTFMQRASQDGLTFVLVITGKGRTQGAGSSERGVLRRQVPEWLSLPEFRALVVGFEEAHIGHGGEGALYVRVRRSKV